MKKLIIVAIGSIIATGVMAKTAGFQASLSPDIAVEDPDTRINGVSLNIWGENPQSALTLGFVNGSTGESKGVSVGLFNYAENYAGFHWGFVNYTRGEFAGLQMGPVNIAGTLNGVQLGWVNIARELSGVQVSWVNYASTVQSGVQVGLVNIIADNSWFSDFPSDLAMGMVFVNWSFGGK
jgi:hypothetical protein